ncbi:MAG: hypothetical protein JWL86_640, partial [Rhizobium sp.]|nr:hypothetical protein [Rhizobium sp.]
MMSPAVTRTEMNNSDDIIREVGVARPARKLNSPRHLGSVVAGCSGKTPYPSKAAAEKSTRRGLVSYRCRHCHK